MANDTVSWQQPGLMALSETDGHGDTCAPIVILDYRHLHDHVNLDIATLDAERAELVRWGLMDTPGEAGMTISQIATALHDHYGIAPVKTVGYDAALSWDTFHRDLIAALTQQQLVIMETSNAAALPDNQPNVKYHFVLIGGIDSTRGYWTCNGDTETALRHGGVVEPVWYSAGALQASGPCGYIILPALAPVSGGGSTVGVPTGWKDDGKTLTAPNGAQVTLGFRQFLLDYPGGWPAMLWPSQEFDGTNNSNLCLSLVLHWEPGQPITIRSGALPPAAPPPPPPPPVDPRAAAALKLVEALVALGGQQP